MVPSSLAGAISGVWPTFKPLTPPSPWDLLCGVWTSLQDLSLCSPASSYTPTRHASVKLATLSLHVQVECELFFSVKSRRPEQGVTCLHPDCWDKLQFPSDPQCRKGSDREEMEDTQRPPQHQVTRQVASESTVVRGQCAFRVLLQTFG